MTTTHPVIIGIDTHKVHVAVAIDAQGARLAALSIPANPKDIWIWNAGHDLMGRFWHSELKELARMALASHGLCFPKGIP